MILNIIQVLINITVFLTFAHIACWLTGLTYRKGDIILFSSIKADVATCTHQYEVLSCNSMFFVKDGSSKIVTKNENGEIKVLNGRKTNRIHRGKLFSE